MAKEIYIVFCHSAYDNFDGGWDHEQFIDSIWDELHDAKERLKDLANEYIEERWYESEEVPGTDYYECWAEDGESVKYEPDSYSEFSFYIEKQVLRSDWVEENKDLPVYYDIKQNGVTA